MTRQVFLDELRIALQGKMNQSHINEHILYYENYIMEQSRKGKSEQQVIEELGDPRLIAKTLIDTTEKFGHRVDEDYSDNEDLEVHYGKFKLNSWYGKLLLIVVLIFILILIANVVTFLLPIVIPAVLIVLILSMFFRNRR